MVAVVRWPFTRRCTPALDPVLPSTESRAAGVHTESRAARVHAVMRPQGLVEVDGVVYPARWIGSEPPPGRDEYVTAVPTEDGQLLAETLHIRESA